ncbi:MAG TPA: kelch repeat-containing protein [Bryobacteraceae bacterium]|nr:kelch repeat-containing protein [Bryobacteraceae bacterium]
MRFPVRAAQVKRFLFSVAVAGMLHAGYGQTSTPAVYSWSPTGPLAVARHSACVAALDDGRGMVAGGAGAAGLLNSVEMYQSDGSFLPGQPLLHARSNHTCTVLNDGRVLVAGGKADSGAAPAEIYDPDADAWSDLDTPGLPRWNQTATLLPDGSVLLAGGDTDSGPSSGLELFNPATNRVELLTASLSTPRTGHATALLPDGRVLITGGTDGSQLLSSVDVYHPDGTVTQELHLPEARAAHSATTLDDGRVLIAGGQGPNGDLNTALLFSPDDNVFHPAGPLAIARSSHLAFVLPGNGSVLIAGGLAAGTPIASTELFDPQTGAFSVAGPLTAARRNIAAAPLNQAGVLLAVGGLNDNGPIPNCGQFISPTLTLDKSTYVQGDNITVSGANWPNNTTLTINSVVRTASGTPTIGFFNVTVTSSGSFSSPNVLPAPLGVATSGGLITFTTHITATVNGAVQNLNVGASATQLDVTTMTLTSSAPKILTLAPVTLSANVKLALAVVPMQGFVSFFDGKVLLGTASTSGGPGPGAPSPGATFTFDVNGNNNFTLPGVTLSAGARNLRAVFTPTSTLLAGSSDASSIQVDKRPTTLTFSTSATATTKVGDSLTLSPAVRPAAPPAPSVLPTGTVEIFRDPVPSFLTVNVAPNSSSGGSTGSQTIVAGPAGTLSLEAAYEGDDNYLPSSVVNASISIAKGQVSFTATPNPVTATAGDLINLTAKISHPPAPGAPATGTITVVNGPANFSSDSVTVSPDLNNASPVNTPVQTFVQDAGSKMIQLHYSGNDNYLAADLQIPATVNKIVPTLSITSFNPVCCDLPFTFRVDVIPPGSLFSPKNPTGLFDTMVLATSLAIIVNIGPDLGDCVLSASTIGHSAGCNPKTEMESSQLIGCTVNTVFTFTYHGDSNYQSQQISVTKGVPITDATDCKQ